MKKPTHLYIPALVLVTMLLASLACGGSATRELSEAAKPTSDSAAPTQASGPGATARPTEPPPSPAPEPEALRLEAQGFGQDGRNLGYAFIVENPNPGLSVESSQYQLAAYDANGTVVETDSGYIELLLPGQKLGIGGTLYLDEGVTVSKIEVQLSEGEAVPSDPLPTFTVDAVSHTPGQFSSHVTGVVTSPYKRAIENVRVSAVIYSASGEIIGGGSSFLNFVPAHGSSGVDVLVASAPDVASVELYPAISALSLLGSNEESPAGAVDLTLIQYGFGQDENEVGFGLIVENPNEGFAVESTRYQVTAYAEDGKVLAVDGGFIDVLLPQQTLGLGGSMFLEEGATVARVEAQILAGDFETTDALPFFAAENVAYQPGDFSSSVTGEIVNPYAKDISNLRVSAIAYDEAGAIIGGGFTFLDFAPANGKAAVEAFVTTAGTPATVELYASLSALSDFK